MQQFAFDLRKLRQQAGRPSYQELAKRAHYAPNTLSEAAKGERLPTLDVTKAFVKACDGDQEIWEKRWWAVHDGLMQKQAANPPFASAASIGTHDPNSSVIAPGEPAGNVASGARRWKLAAAWFAALFVLAGGGGLWVWAHQALTPLYLLRGQRNGALMRIWMMTTDSTEAEEQANPAKIGGGVRYDKRGQIGNCYTRQILGTVPVWHHSHRFKIDGYEQHLYTIETNPRRDDALTWGWTAHDSRPVCYVYPTRVPGTRALYRMREDPSSPGGVIGDGHGHVHAFDQTGYRTYGFHVDQVWYVR